MKYTIAEFKGPAALPGIFLNLVRVHHARHVFFSIVHSSYGSEDRYDPWVFSPLNSVSHHLTSYSKTYPIRAAIDAKGWTVERCAMHMWCIGDFASHPAAARLSPDQLRRIIWILTGLIHTKLTSSGHEVTPVTSAPASRPSDDPLYEIALALFNEFLAEIFPTLLDGLDDNSDDL